MLPLQWLGRLGDMPLVMLVLRQFISVLPMLAALLLLVYMQDGFRTYRSPVLFAFLLSCAGGGAEQFLVSPGWDHVPAGRIDPLLPETG